MDADIRNQPAGPSSALIASFLRSCAAGPLTVIVEDATLTGLAWLAGATDGWDVRLLLGEAVEERWAESAPARTLDTVARFLSLPTVETRFWRPSRGRYEKGSVSVWYVPGPPPAALNATTQLTEACLHNHLDSIGQVRPADLDYVRGWVEETVGSSWDAGTAIPPAGGRT